MTRFEEIKIGDKAELTHTITDHDVRQFAALTGDDNKLHTDEEYARKTSFKKPVAHGMLGASFISTIIGTKLPGDGALWFGQNLEFLLPVRVGDFITVKAEVVKKIDTMHVIELQTDIYNQYKQKVTTGIAKVKIVEQESMSEVMTTSQKVPFVALVVGGSGGIGRASCLQLARDGFDVAVHYYKNKSLADSVVGDIITLGRRAVVVGGDITKEHDVQEMVERCVRIIGAPSIIVNCASDKIPAVSFSQQEWGDIQKMFETNVKGAFLLVKQCAPMMIKSGYGKFIHCITQYIDSAPPVEILPYITAKSALLGFSKALAVELAPKGIRVNMVSPGMTDTELIADVPEKVKLLTAARTPLKRLATPADVAGAISYLASSAADFLTGETIRINGGQTML